VDRTASKGAGYFGVISLQLFLEYLFPPTKPMKTKKQRVLRVCVFFGDSFDRVRTASNTDHLHLSRVNNIYGNDAAHPQTKMTTNALQQQPQRA